MAEILFYHLDRQTLEDVLPTLLERSLERGWRAVVELADDARRDALDRHLWVYRDDSFLPHGSAADGFGAQQPVWLTTGQDNPNGAAVRFLEAPAAVGDVDAYRRVVIIFSADDPQAVARARALWPPLKQAGHDVTYWRQSKEGRWERKG